ncbi:hypothetical protein, conserved [Trypanosoma brucei gambiense DAL972]|uniref:tRNA-splicing endonuclease subunit Sen15 domain-containing protein n=1 Tax=Trypanosoma brucei gambiense (strain MHOM/CI/86/DAL972) TaxID=679716 RepID=C9ZKR7_TRYB9|nr:hypothetical protein, conserved [Trypanosoma brucei gambiense DAL972]CBH10283.1 hypothetical protein, conserved [Trypanosoma brucei gambiense DAL972]|eukprot:XP_011772573.1 hypothetical protein, conserved [Trypanosoma brucei gambiense DAL972]
MIDDVRICHLVLQDVKERLPLYESRLEAVNNSHVVISCWNESVKAFVPVPVSEDVEFTSDVLHEVVSLVDGLRQLGCTDFFVVFVDSGGTLSFYHVDTLRLLQSGRSGSS